MTSLDMRQVLIFLAKIPSDSSIRLMLQLALASDVPDAKLAVIAKKISEGALLTDLLKHDALLVHLLEADGEIGLAEENVLFETIDQIGLVAPTDTSGAEYLLESLTDRIIAELEQR